jgi:hypothetical protein
MRIVICLALAELVEDGNLNPRFSFTPFLD